MSFLTSGAPRAVRPPRRASRAAIATALLVFSGVCHQVVAQTSELQSIPLYTGWNLISFQVNPGGFTTQEFTNALLSDASAVLAIWGYDAVSQSWQVYQPGTGLPSTVASLQRLYPGRGYWVKVAKGVLLQLTGTPWNDATTLVPGWNLVGFPGLTVSPAGKTDFSSIFRGQLSSVPLIWSFSGGTLQRFVGYDTLALPPITDLGGVQPGVGYWVYSTANLTLASTPIITLPPDAVAPRSASDASMPQPELFQLPEPRYSGTNAARFNGRTVVFTNSPADAAGDLNHNGILDDPYTQDTMHFAAGVNLETLSIFNTGTGLMNWYIVSNTPWLSLNPSSGATSTEQDTVQVKVDRNALAPGTYTTQFTIYAGTLVQTVTVNMEVPTIAGDFSGYATTETVNGKAISIGKVDLNLSLFNDPNDSSGSRFHGVINSDRSLLFPTDVYMNGIFYQGLNFSLVTSFPMAAADRDAPPYTSFRNLPANTSGYQGGLLSVGNQTVLPSSDVNSNGLVDVSSIFPFDIRREITLIGARTTADRLEGTYTEAISGPLASSQWILIQGSFVLDRQTLWPTLRSIYNFQTTTNVFIGGSSHNSYTNSLFVGPTLNISDVTVNLNFDFPDPTQLDVILYAPGHTSFYDFGSDVTGSFVLTNFNTSSGSGQWDLVVNWTTGLRGSFKGWGLNIDGLAYHSVTGQVVEVVDQKTNAVSGAVLALVGSNVLPQYNTATNGSFLFQGLTENQYVLSVSKLGYAPVSVSFNIDAADVVTNIVLTALTASNSVLLAQPTLGQAPLNVSLVPIISPTNLAALGTNLSATWRFGDGTQPLGTNAGAVPYTYTNAGSYQPSLTLAGSLGTNILTLPPGGTNPAVPGFVTALAASPNRVGALTNASAFVFAGGFIGSLASSGSADLWVTSATNTIARIITGTNVLAVPSPGGCLFQESERDSANFSFYRNPYGPASAGTTNAWDTTFFVQQVHWTNNLSYYDAHGTDPNVATSQQFRIISTLGGCVFPYETVPWVNNSPAAGEFVLQSGRTED